MLCACLAWLSMQACTIANMADSADGGLKKEDLQGLEKSSIFLFILHSPNPIAAPLFAPCSTQRLYLHEHADFEGIGDVSPHKVHPALSACPADCKTAVLCMHSRHLSSETVYCQAALFYALLSIPASPMFADKGRPCCRDKAGISVRWNVSVDDGCSTRE